MSGNQTEEKEVVVEQTPENNPYLLGQKRLLETGSFYDNADTTLEALYRAKGINDPRIGNAAAYWGINYLKTGSFVNKPRLGQGYVFFTRPRLRLTYHNLRKDRTFMLMQNADPGSVATIVRAYLDPVTFANNGFKCKVVDPRNPFISILSNQCLELSGWNELPVDAYSSRAGLAGEVHSMADGHAKFYGAGSLSASFENVQHDALGFLFHIWTQYMMHCHKGTMMPHVDDLLFNRINYNTRIYRFVTDFTGEYIVDWTATGAAFPLNSTKGTAYDYNKKERLVTRVDELNIQFQVNGMMHMDPYVFKAFNHVVLMFNPDMHHSVRGQRFVKLSPREKPFFNNHALPFIDLKTAKLTWWVRKEQYTHEIQILDGGKKSG